jgi:hypothetical protein
MKSKLFSVRIPADELDHAERLFRRYPGCSPALVVRALLSRADEKTVCQSIIHHGIMKAERGRK